MNKNYARIGELLILWTADPTIRIAVDQLFFPMSFYIVHVFGNLTLEKTSPLMRAFSSNFNCELSSVVVGLRKKLNLIG